MAREREVVGRRLEVEELAAVLERVRGGLHACVLAGPAGIGKTTVWRRGVELGHAAGCLVLSTRPVGSETRLSYAGLADLLAAVGVERFDGLAEVQRRALEVALLRREAGEGGVDAHAVASGLLSLLRALAGTGPVLVAVDDAQWLDAATSAALVYALRRLEDAPVGVLGSVRMDDVRPRTFLDAIPGERTTELVLPPMNLASIHAIVQGELGRVPPRPTLVGVVATSGGNPFYAIEIVRALDTLEQRRPSEGLPVPGELLNLVQARLDRLPRKTRAALLRASCLDVPRTALVGEEALGPAEEAGIVRIEHDGRIRFAHPLLAAAVVESATTAQRRAVHRELASLVGDAEERARHLALATEGADGDVAAQLDAAARLARARGAPEAAAELAELAFRLAPKNDPAQVERLLVGAGLQFEAGDFARSQALLEQTLELPLPSALRALALQRLGQLQARRSSFGAAIALAEEASRETGEPALLAEVELDMAYYSASLGDFPAASTHAQAAVAQAELAADDSLLAIALAARTMAGFMGGNGLVEADLTRALELEDRSRPGPLAVKPRYLYGILSLWVGRVEEALASLEALRQEMLELGSESELPLLSLYLVWGCIWQGDLERAAAYAAESSSTASLLDDSVAVALALTVNALVHAYQGRAELVREEAGRSAELFERLQYRPGSIGPPWALGFVELSLGNPAGVDAALGPIAAALAASPCDPVLCVFLPDEVEALLELGRSAEARSLLEPFEARARALSRTWAIAAAARCRGLLDAAAGDLDGALAALEEADAHHDQAGMPFEHARTLLELGRLRRRRKQKRLARLALEEALAVFETIGTPLWVEKARAELARVTTRRAAEGLTPTEAQVASLAAEGLTNRAIAERTHVTVKAVEANLRRTYRKLGISSRAQLGRALDERRVDTIP